MITPRQQAKPTDGSDTIGLQPDDPAIGKQSKSKVQPTRRERNKNATMHLGNRRVMTTGFFDFTNEEDIVHLSRTTTERKCRTHRHESQLYLLLCHARASSHRCLCFLTTALSSPSVARTLVIIPRPSRWLECKRVPQLKVIITIRCSMCNVAERPW